MSAPLPKFSHRYSEVDEKKSSGATFTPMLLANFLATQTLKERNQRGSRLRILEPAVGDGELLLALLRALAPEERRHCEIVAFDTDLSSLSIARARVEDQFPECKIEVQHGSFLEHIAEKLAGSNLFSSAEPPKYDLIVANPPYVRTQILGTKQAKELARVFGLSGRIDLYQAFVIAIGRILDNKGAAGLIVSNRFMSTKTGAVMRKSLIEQRRLKKVIDLGDTKIFDAAVLPALLFLGPQNDEEIVFSSIYEADGETDEVASDPIDALSSEGNVRISDDRVFMVQHGKLDNGRSSDGVWRLSSSRVDSWLETVRNHTDSYFGDIGKVRVGVKTCADKIFIRSDWEQLGSPELLRPLITHHSARRYREGIPKKKREILYPHGSTNGQRFAVDISQYPRSETYLRQNQEALEKRKYVLEAGRKWYELWVPQDPSAWSQPKLVFRDIADEPTFWIDLEGAVVNGDCYWIAVDDQSSEDLLWLAVAVGNSSFIEKYYDASFPNKLYAGRRRFITQYVEKFPLPDPASNVSRAIVKHARDAHAQPADADIEHRHHQIDLLVWSAFGLSAEEI
ncbi:Eco57I restriction-modification methylase domain-containing protein [Parvularcula maris]|uniref:site-specific DNA-methyltransferase (adenine-specific) n=1 Tax=Parvularcula maris TaxID=2965077 RepID=A0A9X2LB41_9PROT|nr:N-6 DNA methylase [Parvularcula maris]MCQ8186440.1 N-6 DNA methylase [Parvularcula maris]